MSRQSRPESVLQACVDVASRLLHQWRSYEAVEAALANPTMRAAGGSNGGGGDVPDPTFAVVASMEPYADVCAELDEALGHLRAVQRRHAIVRVHHPDIAREADASIRALRCDGDPLCTDNAVRAGKCWRHYRQHLETRSNPQGVQSAQ